MNRCHKALALSVAYLYKGLLYEKRLLAVPLRASLSDYLGICNDSRRFDPLSEESRCNDRNSLRTDVPHRLVLGYGLASVRSCDVALVLH